MVDLTQKVKKDISTENVEFQVLSLVEPVFLTIFLYSMDYSLFRLTQNIHEQFLEKLTNKLDHLFSVSLFTKSE